MKKTINIITLTILFFSLSNCKKKDDVEKKNDYNKNATELITQIFSDSLFECSYIIRPNANSNLLEDIENEMPAINYRNKLNGILRIDNKNTLDSPFGLSKNFDFKDSMFGKKTELIEYSKFDSIRKKLDSLAQFGTEKQIDTFFEKCPNDFYFISKPIFDKNYRTAVIDIQMGLTHLRSHPSIYRLNNGIWEKD